MPRARRPPVRAVAVIAVLALVILATVLFRLALRPGPDPAGGEPRPVLAVGLISDYRGGSTPDIARPLADLLAANLARVPALRTVSTARLYELMEQLGLTGDANAGAYSAAARRAGASMLVDGSLYAVQPEGLRLDLRRIDVATGDVLAAYTVSGKDIFALVDSGTTRLSAGIGLTAPRGSIADVTTHSEVAYRFYEEGLRAYYRGDQLVARRLLQASLAEDSTLAMAAFYLARAYPAGDENLRWIQHARRMAARASDRERLIIGTAWLLWTSDPAAVATADTLTVRYPAELEGHFFAGQALSEAGDFAGALARMRRVVAMDSLALEGVSAGCAACEARATSSRMPRARRTGAPPPSTPR